jgi:hypothetical protein
MALMASIPSSRIPTIPLLAIPHHQHRTPSSCHTALVSSYRQDSTILRDMHHCKRDSSCQSTSNRNQQHRAARRRPNSTIRGDRSYDRCEHRWNPTSSSRCPRAGGQSISADSTAAQETVTDQTRVHGHTLRQTGAGETLPVTTGGHSYRVFSTGNWSYCAGTTERPRWALMAATQIHCTESGSPSTSWTRDDGSRWTVRATGEPPASMDSHRLWSSTLVALIGVGTSPLDSTKMRCHRRLGCRTRPDNSSQPDTPSHRMSSPARSYKTPRDTPGSHCSLLC